MSQRVLIVALCMLAVGCKSRAVVGIAAGKDNTCLRTEDGRVYCFGDDAYMQNKDPSFATRPGPRNSPKRVPGLDGVVDVAVAPSHACVANPSSGLRCFLDVDLEPASVSSFAAKQVVASLSGVCALGASGNVACYRAGARELPRDPVTLPKDVPSATSIAAGERHVCVLATDGTVACWGDNQFGQLGSLDDAALKPNALTHVAGLKDVTSLAAGKVHTCALQKNGKVACWGMNELGQLGRPTGSAHEPIQAKPLDVAGLDGVSSIAAGYYHSCAVVGGKVLCWGSNMHGELGRAPTKMPNDKPEPVPGIGDAVQVACGEQHTCALLRGGKIECWGRNNRGQLGNGTNEDSIQPVDVKLP